MARHTFRESLRVPILVAKLAAGLFRMRLNAAKAGARLEVVILMERLGDLVACEPAALACKTEGQVHVAWICADRFLPLVRQFRGVDGVFSLICLGDLRWCRPILFGLKLRNLHPSRKTCDCCGRSFAPGRARTDIDTTNYYHHGPLQSAFFSVAGLSVQRANLSGAFSEVAKRASKTPRDKPYVVVHCSSEELSRSWPASEWMKLLPCLQQRFPDHEIIEIGGRPVLAPGMAVDLCSKLGLLELVELMRGATAFVGIDSGPSHVAHAVGVPRLLLLGRYRAFHRYLPYEGFLDSASGGIVARHFREVPFLTHREVAPLVASWQPGSPPRIHDFVTPVHELTTVESPRVWRMPAKLTSGMHLIRSEQGVGLGNFVQGASGELPAYLALDSQEVAHVGGLPLLVVTGVDGAAIDQGGEFIAGVHAQLSNHARVCFLVAQGGREMLSLWREGKWLQIGEANRDADGCVFTFKSGVVDTARSPGSTGVVGNCDLRRRSGKKIYLSGWCVIQTSWIRPADRILLVRNQDGVWKTVAEVTEYRSERSDVSAHFRDPSVLFSGWSLHAESERGPLALLAIDAFTGDALLLADLSEL